MVFWNRPPLPPEEVYSLAVDAANHESSGAHFVRRNHMVVTGSRAHILGEIGALVMGMDPSQSLPPVYGHQNSHHDAYFSDYVAIGSDAAFTALEQIIVPASKLVGPDNFSMVPCDSDGNRLPDQASVASDAFLASTGSDKFKYRLADTYDECWLSISAGVAASLARGTAYKHRRDAINKATELARSDVAWGYAYAAIDEAAAGMHRAALAAQTLPREEGRGVPIRVMVEPNNPTMMNGDETQQAPFGKVITIFDGENFLR